MDNTTAKNQQKWDELVKLEVPCSRPNKNPTIEQAKKNLNPNNIFGDLKGKTVLCLASGGGQQSIEFALLGANVTVVDFSKEQLKKDTAEAKKHNLTVRIIQSDMRDLSQFRDQEFDIVYQPYSINYIPEVQKVFNEVSRVLKRDGIYHLMFHNPFVQGSWKDSCWGSQWKKQELWNNKGYPISQPYRDGEPIKIDDQTWNFEDTKGRKIKAEAPQEFRHTLSTVINSLIEREFNLLRFEEYKGDNSEAEPGTWDHYITVAPPWLSLWAKKIA
jgi:SAM-dependent methyltransferase